MKVFIKDIARTFEILAFWAIGLVITLHIAGNIYGRFGIEFTGNVWVNWFGISYFLLVIYTVVMGTVIIKDSDYYKQFLTSKLCWIIFVGSIYIIVIPFIKGENPF
ncbi:hypothetical protein ACM26V_07755 [Salipaludibacillus sp. HK11]|uniref:hypothetical protein n=1 Tax=Salipaludibacillus sp. HK11 TaxID=3394320 RepID=UPI0039FDBFC0